MRIGNNEFDNKMIVLFAALAAGLLLWLVPTIGHLTHREPTKDEILLEDFDRWADEALKDKVKSRTLLCTKPIDNVGAYLNPNVMELAFALEKYEEVIDVSTKGVEERKTALSDARKEYEEFVTDIALNGGDMDNECVRALSAKVSILERMQGKNVSPDVLQQAGFLAFDTNTRMKTFAKGDGVMAYFQFRLKGEKRNQGHLVEMVTPSDVVSLIFVRDVTFDEMSELYDKYAVKK